jgi:hypothetical protein
MTEFRVAWRSMVIEGTDASPLAGTFVGGLWDADE